MKYFERWLRCWMLILAMGAVPHSAAAAQPAKPQWSVRGDADQPPFTQLGMAFITGSTVLLADNDVMQILRIVSTGKVMQRFGGKGAGLGEFT